MKVTFLGLGNMGSAMAKCILKKGFQLCVWTRTSSKAHDLVAIGARSAATVQEAVIDSDVVISCLFDDKSCLDIAQGENGYLSSLKQGAVCVNATTITPSAASELEKIHEKYNVHYVAGPVFGRPDAAAAGKLRSFLGGKKEAIEIARPVIESYSGGGITVIAENPVEANVIKLTANMLLVANISLFGQVYALNERWNIDHSKTQEILKAFYSHPALLAYETRVRDRNYERPDGEGFDINGGLKDINAMISAGDQVGVSLPFCKIIKEEILSSIDGDLKNMDWSILGDITRLKSGYSPPSQTKQD